MELRFRVRPRSAPQEIRQDLAHHRGFASGHQIPAERPGAPRREASNPLAAAGGGALSRHAQAFVGEVKAIEAERAVADAIARGLTHDFAQIVAHSTNPIRGELPTSPMAWVGHETAASHHARSLPGKYRKQDTPPSRRLHVETVRLRLARRLPENDLDVPQVKPSRWPENAPRLGVIDGKDQIAAHCGWPESHDSALFSQSAPSPPNCRLSNRKCGSISL